MTGDNLISTDSFKNFISEKDPDLKQLKGNTLISFAFPLPEKINVKNGISHFIKVSKKLFYFEHPEKDFIFFGINESINISGNGPGRFAQTEKETKNWKQNFINNWDVIEGKRIPLFAGGMKFTVEHPDEMWKDFPDSGWFVPEFVYLQSNGKPYYLYNFIYSRSADKNQFIEKFKKGLAAFINFNPEPSAKKVCIKEISGNTPKDKKRWKQIVSDALESILDKQADKIVLSREVKLTLSNEPDYSGLISQLAERYSSCYIFLMHAGKSVFLGATPEKLACFHEDQIEIDALAGSAPRGLTPEQDTELGQTLLTDQKNLHEHQLVVSFLKDALKNSTSDFSARERTLKKLENIQHILTPVSACLKNTGTIFSILNEMFPTPAVCGYPQKAALDFIKKNELYRRGMYSGIIGWFNFSGDAEFVVGIRSALIQNNTVYSFAGGGIVPDSNPDMEFTETQLKLKPILSLFPNEN